MMGKVFARFASLYAVSSSLSTVSRCPSLRRASTVSWISNSRSRSLDDRKSSTPSSSSCPDVP